MRGEYYLRGDVLVTEAHKMFLPLPFLSKQCRHNLLLFFNMSSSKQRPSVLVKSIPLKLIEEGESELCRHLGELLNLRHSELLLDGEAVEEVASKHEAVLRSVH